MSQIKENLLFNKPYLNKACQINLYVVYEDKDLARRDGAFFNPDLKTWQCEENNERCIKKYKRVYFNAGYDQRDYIKTLGAKWDSDVKQWYCSMGHKILIDEFVKIKI